MCAALQACGNNVALQLQLVHFSWGCCCSHLVPAPRCRWCAATTRPPSPSTSGRARRRSGGWRLCNSKWQASSCTRALQGGCLVLVPLPSFTSTVPNLIPRVPSSYHSLSAGTRTFLMALSRLGGSQWATTPCRCGRGCMDSHTLRWMRLPGCLFFPRLHIAPPRHLHPLAVLAMCRSRGRMASPRLPHTSCWTPCRG